MAVFLILQGKICFVYYIYSFGVLSDGVDGYVARKYNATTKLGKKLDPIGSSILVNLVIIALLFYYPEYRYFIIPWWGIAGAMTHSSGFFRRRLPCRFKPIATAVGLFSGAVMLDFSVMFFLGYLSYGSSGLYLTVIATLFFLFVFGKHKKYYTSLKEGFFQILQIEE